MKGDSNCIFILKLSSKGIKRESNAHNAVKFKPKVISLGSLDVMRLRIANTNKYVSSMIEIQLSIHAPAIYYNLLGTNDNSKHNLLTLCISASCRGNIHPGQKPHPICSLDDYYFHKGTSVTFDKCFHCECN